MNINILDGNREGSYVYTCGDGFHYHYNNGNNYGENENTSSVIYMRCTNHHSKLCRGSARVVLTPEGAEWVNLERHTCAPDHLYERVKQMRGLILKAATQHNGPYETPTSLVDRLRNRICTLRGGVNIAARLTPTAMKSAVNRARSAMYPPIPLTLYDLGLLLSNGQYPILSRTIDGTDNIFNGGVVHGNGFTSIIFLSRRMRRFMRRVRMVFCDGTFRSRPNEPDSGQILQLSAVVRNHVVPLAQILMTGKTEEEYTAVLHHVRQMVPQFQPTLVMTDFETAMQNSWERVFNARVVGCYWHYCRAVIRKAKELGLAPFMRENRWLKSLVRATCGIPLLPNGLMQSGLQSLMREAAQRNLINQLEPFFNYMIDTWMTPHMLARLSVFRMKHRTNNVSESNNMLLRSRTGGHRPGLYRFLCALRRHEQAAYLSLRTMNLGLPLNRARKVTSVNNDRIIINYTIDLLQGTISINKFLHRASTRVMNVFNDLLRDLFLIYC